MSKWPVVSLKSVATPVERPVRPEAGTRYRQLGVKLWGEGAYERESIDGCETKYSTFWIARTDDIVVNKIWARNGSVAVVQEELDGCVGSNEFPTFAVDKNQLVPRWIHWLTKAKRFWEKCDEKSRGTSGKNRIRPEQFLEITIPLPSLAEQRRLVERIDALAAKIEEAKGLRHQANQHHAAFISGINNDLGKGRSVRIGDFVELHEDRVPVAAGVDFPQVGLKGFGGGLFSRAAICAHETTYKCFNRLYEGAVVLSQVKGWEGAIAVCSDEFAGRFASPEYRTFRAIPHMVLSEYLAAIIPTPWFWHQLGALTRGVGARRERIRPEMFLDLKITLPQVSDQRIAIAIFQHVNQAHNQQASILEELDAMLPSILDQAFRGEL